MKRVANLTRAFVFLVAALAFRATDADWPQFRGPGGRGVSAAARLPATWSADENIIWKTRLPGPGASSPVVVEKRIFLACYSGYGLHAKAPGDMRDLRQHVVCVHLDNGKILWTGEVETKLQERPYESVLALHGYASSTPAADSQRVYASFGKSGVFAFDHDGRRLWHADVGSQMSGWGSAASIVLYENLVIVNASIEARALVTVNMTNGNEVWRSERIRNTWNTPVLVDLPGGKTELVVAVDGQLLGFDPATGEALWTCAGIEGYVAPSAVAHDGIVYAIGRERVAVAVRAGGRGDVTATHRLWIANKGSNTPSPVYHDGYLYFAKRLGGILCCLDATSGAVVYERRLSPPSGDIYASPLLADGRIYYVSRRNGAYVLAAKPEFELLAHNKISTDDSVFNASPAALDGRLLLRSDRYLYCVGTRHSELISENEDFNP